MTEEASLYGDYNLSPKGEDISSLRALFDMTDKPPMTEAEKAFILKIDAYTRRIDAVRISCKSSIRDLLEFHWSSYDYDTWTRGMDTIANLLRLEECKTIFELGFGSGAILRYFKETQPHLSLSGNDFFEKFVELAKRSEHIGDGAFVHVNSKYLDFIPDSTFEALLSWGSIGYEHKDNVREIFKNLIRICKSGGRILVGNMDNSEDLPSKEYKTSYQTSFSKSELEEIMREEPVEIIALATDQEVIGIEGHLAGSRLTICMEKLK